MAGEKFKVQGQGLGEQPWIAANKTDLGMYASHDTWIGSMVGLPGC